MIPILIIMAVAASAVALAALAKYWQEIVAWFKKAVDKIKQVMGVAVKGTKSFITKTAEGFQDKAKHYHKNSVTEAWEEIVYTKSVSENEVPLDILAKVQRYEINIEVETTEELTLILDGVA